MERGAAEIVRKREIQRSSVFYGFNSKTGVTHCPYDVCLLFDVDSGDVSIYVILFDFASHFDCKSSPSNPFCAYS